jgi:hypothetical protein
MFKYQALLCKIVGSSRPESLETDPRFPSGAWAGFFLQPALPGRHMMELILTFVQGEMTGEGRDSVGSFHVRGQYELVDGQCHFTKRYVGKHDVFYRGYNEGKGIWGVWEMAWNETLANQRGGFHIWPEGMGDPTQLHLTEEAALPVEAAEPVRKEEPVAAPAGSQTCGQRD